MSFFDPPLANMKDFSKPVFLPLRVLMTGKKKYCKNNFVLNMIDAQQVGPPTYVSFSAVLL